MNISQLSPNSPVRQMMRRLELMNQQPERFAAHLEYLDSKVERYARFRLAEEKMKDKGAIASRRIARKLREVLEAGMTIEDAAAHLGLTVATVQDFCKDGFSFEHFDDQLED